jgi:hypothetical protein
VPQLGQASRAKSVILHVPQRLQTHLSFKLGLPMAESLTFPAFCKRASRTLLKFSNKLPSTDLALGPGGGNGSGVGDGPGGGDAGPYM